MAGESQAAGGTVTLGNANSVQLTGTDTSYIGIGTTSSTGQVDIANTRTLALSTQGGNATGLYIAGGGTAGDGALTNQGVLSVATQSSAGGARAIGMDVEQEIGRAHVCNPVTNAQLVCRLLLEKKNTKKHINTSKNTE